MKTAAPAAKTKPRHIVKVEVAEGACPDAATARLLTHPAVQAASVMQAFQGDNQEVNALIVELQSQIKAVNGGDLGRAEAMLISQAHTLEEIFCALARRASANISGGYPDAAERYLRLALKAQSQCRTTLETLAEIKNPRPVAFVRQANIAAGNQQVNNGPIPLPRAEEREIPPTKLLEEVHGERLDFGATSAAGRANPGLEALGAINRPEDAGGQSKGAPQRVQGRSEAGTARAGAPA